MSEVSDPALISRKDNFMAVTAAITGATGFIGSVLAEKFLGEGVKVRALVRSCSLQKCWQHPNLEWITGDIQDPDSLDFLAASVDVLIHCAGMVKGFSDRDFQDVNVNAVKRLADVCCRQPVPPRFLLISSLAARQPELSAYARSKKMGEQVLGRLDSSRVGWTIFRPPAVYGPGDREMRPLFRCMEHGIVPCLANKKNRFSLLHVHDLADSVVAWMRSGKTAGRIYELHDGFPGGYSWNDVAEIFKSVYERRLFKLYIPKGLLHTAALLNYVMGRLTGSPAMLSPGKARELAHPDWVCDNGKIFEDTGWMPGIRLEDALRHRLI